MTMSSRFAVVCALVLAGALSGFEPLNAEDGPLSFNHDIRPILSGKCFACHGFDAKKQEAELRLDTAEGATAERDGVRAVAPGDLGKSELWRRVTSTDADEMMPPPASNKTLTDGEKNLLRRWIEEGAKYQKHWAFEAIERPAAPDDGTRSVPTTNSIDAFLSQKIDRAGLTVNREADRGTLIRRVAFTLTGLPPTIEVTDTYMNDVVEGAYERVVNGYLQLPGFG